MGAAAALKEQVAFDKTLVEARTALKISVDDRGDCPVSMLSPAVRGALAKGDSAVAAIDAYLESLDPAVGPHSEDAAQALLDAIVSCIVEMGGLLELGSRVLKVHPDYWTVDMQQGFTTLRDRLDDRRENLALMMNAEFRQELARHIESAEENSTPLLPDDFDAD